MKQTFNIPDGCKEVTVEQVGNQLITTFEPAKYTPKIGDYVKLSQSELIFFGEVKKFRNNTAFFHISINKKENKLIDDLSWLFNFSGCKEEKLTPEQFQEEFKKLGYVYDFETHTATKKRWRAEKEHKHYVITDTFKVIFYIEDNLTIDLERYNAGNYFQTRQQAQEAAEFLKQQLKEFNNTKN